MPQEMPQEMDEDVARVCLALSDELPKEERLKVFDEISSEINNMLSNSSDHIPKYVVKPEHIGMLLTIKRYIIFEYKTMTPYAKSVNKKVLKYLDDIIMDAIDSF